MVGQQQELRSKAAPATVLALNPKTTTKTKGDIFSFDIQIDTASNNVAMAELHLMYDATKLEALSITNGPLAPKIAASGVVGSGTASITVRAENTTKPIKGTGTIAVIRFKAIGATDVPIQVKFDTTTFVSGLEKVIQMYLQAVLCFCYHFCRSRNTSCFANPHNTTFTYTTINSNT